MNPLVVALVVVGATAVLSWAAYMTKQMMEHAKWMASANVTTATIGDAVDKLTDLVTEHDRWERDRAVQLLDQAVAATQQAEAAAKRTSDRLDTMTKPKPRTKPRPKTGG